MGEESDDASPTEVGPTALGSAIDETEAHTAWALEEYEEPPRRTWPIVAAAVIAAVVAFAVAAGLAVHHARQPVLGDVVAMTAPDWTATSSAPPVGKTGFEIPPPPTATVTVTAAPPASVAPESEVDPLDGLFVSKMRARGWEIYNPWTMTSNARSVCSRFRAGQARWQVMVALTAAERQWTVATANEFIDAVQETYPNCP